MIKAHNIQFIVQHIFIFRHPALPGSFQWGVGTHDTQASISSCSPTLSLRYCTTKHTTSIALIYIFFLSFFPNVNAPQRVFFSTTSQCTPFALLHKLPLLFQTSQKFTYTFAFLTLSILVLPDVALIQYSKIYWICIVSVTENTVIISSTIITAAA